MKKAAGALRPRRPRRDVGRAYRGCLSIANTNVGVVKALVCGARLLATDLGISMADMADSGIVLPPIGSRLSAGTPGAPVGAVVVARAGVSVPAAMALRTNAPAGRCT